MLRGQKKGAKIRVVTKMKNKLHILLIIAIIFTAISGAYADDWYGQYGDYYKVYNTENNDLLFETAREVSRGDQYLSEDNKMYRVVRVNTKNFMAYAEFVEDVDLPKVNKEALKNIKLALESGSLATFLLAQAGGDQERQVGIYATHSAESYKPSDGEESTKGGGGIIKVAQQLKNNFQNFGVEAHFDNSSHEPHDAGAYKRSRRTAAQLMRNQGINTLIDVHRDAVPAEQYLAEIEGEPVSKVRLVVGRRNQNFKANEELATKIKSVADEMRPGLIKDIFYAKGDYNQDLTPRAMLTEIGTYSHTRQRAEKTTKYLSEVITTALFGGVMEEKTPSKAGAISKTPKAMETGNKGSKTGMLGLIAAVIIGGIAFVFISSGSKEWKSKFSNLGQEFSNFIGRRKKK